MQNRLACIIKKYRQACDYMEIRVEDYENRSIQIRTGDTQIKDSMEMGGNVRVLKKGAWGFASFNDLDLLDDFAEKAIKQAEKAGNTGTMLTSVPSVFELVKIEPVPGKFSLKDRIKFLNSYNKIVLNYNRKLITILSQISEKALNLLASMFQPEINKIKGFIKKCKSIVN